MAPKSDKKGRSALKEVVTREYTIHLHKYIHGMYVLYDRLYRSVGLQVLIPELQGAFGEVEQCLW